MSNTSYTMQIVDSMMDGMIAKKESHGFRRLKNGLFEDCLGQVFTVDLCQETTTIGEGEEASTMYHVELKMKPVNVMGRI